MKAIVPYLLCILAFSKADFWDDRNELLKSEESLVLGSTITLTSKESQVNDKLMELKFADLDNAFVDPSQFLPAQHFFRSKDLIRNSPIFKFIQKLPKGGSLHGHDLSLTSFEFIYNMTYSDNLYACLSNDNQLKMHFFKPSAINADCDNAWVLVSELRAANASFDDWLKSQLTLIVPNPEEAYMDINVVWSKMQNIFYFVEPLLTYKSVFEQQFYQFLLELYEDNVHYTEFRGYLPTVYDLDGRLYNPKEVVQVYVEILAQFKKDYPDFQGARLIYAPSRAVDNKTMDDYIKTALELKTAFPDFVAGFDLVGQEDLGKPLIDFLGKLQNVSKQINVFFHAGETNWYGESTDINIIDAILLGTKRIGHGYALIKHPRAMELVKERQIAIEVNPISNQVLKLVDDIRNHPACVYIAQGYPVVIGNDDPSFWGATGLSYDWYMAFVGMTSRNTDLRFLKQLALNSYLFNAMEQEEKRLAIEEWERDWDKFIDSNL